MPHVSLVFFYRTIVIRESKCTFSPQPALTHKQHSLAGDEVKGKIVKGVGVENEMKTIELLSKGKR